MEESVKTCLTDTNPVKIYPQGVFEFNERSKSKILLEEITKRIFRNQRSNNKFV